MSVEKARADLERIRSEMDVLRGEILQKEVEAGKIAAYIEMTDRYGVSEPPKPARNNIPHAERSERQQPSGLPPKNVRVALEVLREIGRPTPTKVLVAELEKRGVHTGGKIPVTNLSSALSRFRTIFRADRSEGWSLLEWDNAADDAEPDYDATNDELAMERSLRDAPP